MADKYINEVGLQAIKTWIEGKFALDADLDTLEQEVQDLITEGGEPNVINTVKVNGTALTPDAQKAVDVTVPTKVSDLTNDGDGTTGSAFATEAYVQTNGGKIDKIKVNYDELPIDSTDKSVNVVVPGLEVSTDNEEDVKRFYGTIWEGDSGINITSESDNIFGIRLYNGSAAPIINKTYNTYTKDYIDSSFPTNTGVDAKIATALANEGNAYQTASDVNSAISTAVSSAYKYKGSVATTDALPTSDQTVGDVYNVEANGMNYAWDGSAWDALGQLVDTSVLWTSTAGQTNSLIAMTNAEVMAILEPSA